MISVYQIYFDENTKKHLEPEFIPYLNEVKDGYFENSVIKKIYETYDKSVLEQNAEEYIGISSWKQRSKTYLTGKEIISHIENDINNGTPKDVYLYPPVINIEFNKENTPAGYEYNGIIKAPDIWTLHKSYGKPVSGTDDLLDNSKVLPYDLVGGKWIYSYSNYWIAKKSVFNEYCKKMLLPAIKLFEQDHIKKLIPEWYVHAHENKAYNSCLFTLEGLFGTFLANNSYSYSYIVKKHVSKRMLRKINILEYERTEILI